MLINKLYNAPAFRLFILFSAGILIGKEMVFNPFVIIILAITAIIFLLTSRELHSYSADIIISVIIILAGIAKSNYDFCKTDNTSLINLKYNHSDVFLEGVVSDLPENGSDKLQFRLESERMITAEDTLEISGDALVTVRQTKETSDTSAGVVPEAGDRVILFGDLADAPEGANPGEFDYRNYLLMNDIQKTFRVHFKDDIKITGKDNSGFLKMHVVLPARKYAIENINKYVGGNEGAFLNGLVTGYRSDIPREMKEDFVKAGVMHILAVSGLNVAYVILMLSFVLSMLRTGLTFKIILYIAALLFYTFFTGASASIIRAVIMGSLMLLVFVVQRKPNFYNIIGLSAVIILAIDSRQLFNPGFILTYASVLSIVYFTERICEMFPSLGKQKKGMRQIIDKVLMLVLSGIAAQAGVLPITVYYFSKISLSGILTNLAAIPLSNISLGLGFFQITAGAASPYLCELIAGTNRMLLKFQLWLIHGAADFRYSHIEYYGISFIAIFTYYLVLIILTSADRKRIFTAVTASVIIIGAAALTAGFKEENLKVTVLSLGNSDCTHIETPDGSNILIDAGTETPFIHTNTRRVIPYLKYKGMREIDLLIITNDIRKNYYALKYLNDNFRVRRIAFIMGTETIPAVQNIFSAAGTEFIQSNRTDRINGFGIKEIKLLKAESEAFMVKVTYGSSVFLFAGNAGISEESEIINSYGKLLRSDVLVLARHGSGKSTSDEFLKAVSPDACVISAGGNYRTNIPSRQTLLKLKESGIKIYRTDSDNALIFESDGETITLER